MAIITLSRLRIACVRFLLAGACIGLPFLFQVPCRRFLGGMAMAAGAFKISGETGLNIGALSGGCGGDGSALQYA